MTEGEGLARWLSVRILTGVHIYTVLYRVLHVHRIR